jgi:hypothetical protein
MDGLVCQSGFKGLSFSPNEGGKKIGRREENFDLFSFLQHLD